MQTAERGALPLLPRSSATMPEPRFEGKDTPKICLEAGAGGFGPGGAPSGGERLRRGASSNSAWIT